MHVDDEADATGVVLVRGVVETLLSRHPACPVRLQCLKGADDAVRERVDDDQAAPAPRTGAVTPGRPG
jgi:anti-sigma factor RsiW